MRLRHAHTAFLICAALMAWLLRSAPFDEPRVALMRLDSTLRLQPAMKEEISRNCASLAPKTGTEIETELARRLAPMKGNPNGAACTLTVQSAHSQRFHLQSYWSFVLQVSGNGTSFDRGFSVEFPRPLCFLPVVLFVLTLLFRLGFWGLGWTVGTYLFCLGGLNLIRTLSLTGHAAILTAFSDSTLPGLMAIALWLALYRVNEPRRPQIPHPRLMDHTVRHFMTFFVGLWNPLVYSIAGRALYPLRGTLTRLRPFLDTQLLFACLSLSLLSLDFGRGLEGVQHSVLLPRYFSCAALIFLVFNYSLVDRKTSLALELPPFWRGIASVLVLELIAPHVSWLAELPRLQRIGVALLLSELPFLNPRSLLRALKIFAPWAAAIYVAAFFNVVSRTTGATDLALTLFNPQSQPDSLVFTTFLAGLGIGFLTGNVSLSFFALFPAVLPGHESAMVKAALLDGILGGNLLSPFSLFNLLPAAQFEMSLERLVVFRFQQLAPALFIGGAIYAVSSVGSVAILQPVTFVFLCLVALAFQLSKSSWRMVRFMP